MTRIALACLALAACTTDLHLGSRETACDPASATCACTSVAECPEFYACVATSNAAAGTCQPAVGCTALPMGGLDCPNSPCNPATSPNCDPRPSCQSNLCSNAEGTCCAADQRCYPLDCIDCCS